MAMGIELATDKVLANKQPQQQHQQQQQTNKNPTFHLI
jgi:hypothetical protein